MGSKVKEYGYIQFPLCLLQETFRNVEEGLNLILDFGIVNYARKLPYSLEEAAKQVCYYYYRNRNILQQDILNKISKAERSGMFTPDEDYNGFTGDSFNPEENIDELMQLFSKDSKFKDDCIIHYQIHLATSGNHLNIAIGSNDNTIRRYNKALKLKEIFESRYGADAMPMIKKGIIFDFRDNKENDINLFRGLVSVKSLIGLKNFIATHKTVILMRMLGCKSKASLSDFLQNCDLASEAYKKYSGRKRMDNLLYKLMERGFITMLSKKHENRIYLSTRYQTPVEFAEAIIKYRNERDIKKQLMQANLMI